MVLRREIQNSLENPLSEFLLGKVFHDAKGIKVDVKQKEFEFLPAKIKSKQKPPPSKSQKREKGQSNLSIPNNFLSFIAIFIHKSAI